MKTLLLILTATVLSLSSFAQIPTYQSRTISTPYGDRTITTPGPTMRPFGPEPRMPNAKDEFTVIMKDDSAFLSKTKIDHASRTHSVTVRDAGNNKKKIYPAQTKGLIRIDETGNELYGIPTDSCWLFQSASGRINSFSYLAETGMDYVIAIQRGDEGRIVPLTKQNLLPMVGTHPKLLKLINKGMLIKAVKQFNKMDDLELYRE